MYVVKKGRYIPELEIVPDHLYHAKKPLKVPTKMKLLPQTPVGMSNTQTSAKFMPVAKRKNRDKKI